MNLTFVRPGVILLLGLSFFGSFGQTEEDPVKVINDHRAKQQKEMQSRKESPLSKEDRRHFKGLNYYPIDLSYRVKARFVKTETPIVFKMKTTTTRLPEYSKYGEVYFELQGEKYKLEVYHNADIAKRPGYEDYLFIPFTDQSNGNATYEVGRYIDFRTPTTEEVVIDFNLCYNPYCSYSPNYSCPIPPEANYLPLEVRAGEMKFKSGH